MELEDFLKEYCKKLMTLKTTLVISSTDENESSKTSKNWKELIKLIVFCINKLPAGRKSGISNQARIDLDPIVITPVESLNHAYYHLAYHRDFEAVAQKTRIPFPNERDPKYPKHFLEHIFNLGKGNTEQMTTFAIASRNTDDHTLRLGPIPQSHIGKFYKIKLTEYSRSCYRECFANGLKTFGEDKVLEFIDPKLCATNKHKKNIGKNKVRISGNVIKCKGTSRGLMTGFTEALNKIKTKHNINIWRAYNQINHNYSEQERGSITYLVQYKEGANMSKDLARKVKEELYCILSTNGASEHLNLNDILIEQLVGGRIFVSLPFNHAMSKRWLEIIKTEGHKVGFDEIFTVKTYTKPVTSEIAKKIVSSDAMLQILSLPINDADATQTFINPNSMVWLHAEYLSAVANGKPVVRLVDKKSIDQLKLLLGRDHASFDFDVSATEKEFRRTVKKALKQLRLSIAPKLGLS